jgi:hypothetical protein
VCRCTEPWLELAAAPSEEGAPSTHERWQRRFSGEGLEGLTPESLSLRESSVLSPATARWLEANPAAVDAPPPMNLRRPTAILDGGDSPFASLRASSREASVEAAPDDVWRRAEEAASGQVWRLAEQRFRDGGRYEEVKAELRRMYGKAAVDKKRLKELHHEVTHGPKPAAAQQHDRDGSVDGGRSSPRDAEQQSPREQQSPPPARPDKARSKMRFSLSRSRSGDPRASSMSGRSEDDTVSAADDEQRPASGGGASSRKKGKGRRFSAMPAIGRRSSVGGRPAGLAEESSQFESALVKKADAVERRAMMAVPSLKYLQSKDSLDEEHDEHEAAPGSAPHGADRSGSSTHVARAGFDAESITKAFVTDEGAVASEAVCAHAMLTLARLSAHEQAA